MTYLMTENTFLFAGAPVAGLAAYCLSHVAASRLLAAKNVYALLALCSIVGLLTVLAVTTAALRHATATVIDAISLFAMNGLTYFALAFGYFCFVNLTVTSLRIRLLQELLTSSQPMPQSELLARHDSTAVAELRIERLVRGGHIVERNGRYYRGRMPFLAIARVFGMLRWLILGQSI